MTTHPYLDSYFSIPWAALTPERALVDVREAIQQAQAAIEQLCAVRPEDATYESTFAALECASDPLARAWGRLNHQQSINDSPELRDVLNTLMPEVVMFSSSITLNPALYAVLKSAAAAPWVAELSSVKQRFITETMLDFRESGAELDDAQKLRYTEILTRLAELSQKFGEHVLDSTNAWEYVTADASELAGLPDSALAAARQSALEKGYGTPEAPQWRFTLQMPSLIPVLTFADDASLRERVWRGSNTKGTGEYDTSAMIPEILQLRAERAQMFGYACPSDYTLSRRMAGSGKRALDFINDLHDKVVDAFLAEQEAIRVFAEEQSGEAMPLMRPWDIGYWNEKRRKALYDFDSEQLRPYFSMPQVIAGMFEIFSELFGIRVEQRETFYRASDAESCPSGRVEVWHPEVEFFDVYNAGSDEHLGSFYTDWHPRESKRAGAWMNCLDCGVPPSASLPRLPHLGLMCGNMSRPVDGKPALLTHDEVTTVFHEFGHLLHQLLSDVEVRALAGTNVAWDFVELPSQINENWAWQRDALNRFALHYVDGSCIPAELLDKMLAARNYGAASFCMRQLSFGKIDLELHNHPSALVGRDLEEYDRETLADYRVKTTESGNSMLRGFSHIFDGGYEAGYYSYKWAEMLEADAFSRFEKEGIFNPETGRAFRRCILAAGSSKPADELYRDFMGRKPDASAMLKRDGIA